MKKLFLTSGLLTMLAIPAMAETKWFVGAGIGYAEPVFSDIVDDAIDDDIFEDGSGTLALSLTGGMRFGEHDKIYNGGVSATFANMTDLMHLSDGDMYPYDIDITLDFKTLYFTYDNYIRLSGDAKCRTDFIISVGLGYGWGEESLSEPGYGTETYKDSALLSVIKFGFGGETVVDGLSWAATMNVIALNAEDESDLQGSFGFDFGLKYTF